jgi:hypothetical protein
MMTSKKSRNNWYEDDFFSADDFLINIIKRAVSNAQDIHVSLPGYGSLMLLSTHGEYFDRVDNMMQFCSAPFADFKVSILSKKQGRVQGDIGRNIDELMWMAGFYASNGRLMEGAYRDDVVELLHWPNLTRLPATQHSMGIASLLTSHPTSITLAHRFLGIEISEIYQFYAAARCAGIIRVVNRAPEEPSFKPHRNQPLLSMLLDKIVGI